MDDMATLQRVNLTAALTGEYRFVDAGTYVGTRTLFIPQTSRICRGKLLGHHLKRSLLCECEIPKAGRLRRFLSGEWHR